MRVAYTLARDTATRQDDSASNSTSTMTSLLTKRSEWPFWLMVILLCLFVMGLYLVIVFAAVDDKILKLFRPNKDWNAADENGETSTVVVEYFEEKLLREPSLDKKNTTPVKAPVPVWRKTPEELESELTGIQDSADLSAVVTDEERFGKAQPAKTSDPPVIVTALFDIGRGDWNQFTRPFDDYLEHLNHLIRMPNPIIIFGDEEVARYVKIYPSDIQKRIQMVRTTLKDLPFYSHYNEIKDILDYEQENWHSSWPERFKTHPEAWSAEYNIVVNSKSHFMYKAMLISRFPTTFFVWVDAGYSHGSRDIIPRKTWRPDLPRNRITVLQVSPPTEKVERYELPKIYRQTRDVISGGVLAGDRPTIKRFHVFFIKTFTSLLDKGKVDDDQTTLLMTIKHYRSTFNILHGGWLDAFKVIPRLPDLPSRR